MTHMELQLGLSLPSNDVKGFDLNCYLYDPNEIMSSDPSWNNFGCLASVPIASSCSSNKDDFCCNNNKKRSFDEAFEPVKAVPRTLPLLHWNKQPDDEDNPKSLDYNSSFGSNKYIHHSLNSFAFISFVNSPQINKLPFRHQ